MLHIKSLKDEDDWLRRGVDALLSERKKLGEGRGVYQFVLPPQRLS
jgi:hypothetical protein